jgi:UDP-perosamine 4-acetyltransferase
MKQLQTGYDLVLFGGGGHARVVLDALYSSRPDFRVAVLDPELPRGRFDCYTKAEVLGGDDEAPALVGATPSVGFAVGRGVVGVGEARRRLFELGLQLGMSPTTIVHDSAVVSPSATIEDGAQILAGAIVNPGARIGPNAVVNTRAVVEHDCVVASHANIAPAACLCGGVTVGEGAYIGASAVVIQNLHIGENALVGAGSVVVRDVVADTVVLGVPARQLRHREKQT